MFVDEGKEPRRPWVISSGLGDGSEIGGFYNDGRRFFEPYLINYTGAYCNGVRTATAATVVR